MRSWRGLTQIEGEIEAGSFVFKTALEDIHFNIEQRLTDLVGEPGRRLHTARSRNDQVATDFKLWVRDAMDRAEALHARAAARCCSRWPSAMPATVMPGFTHLQAAQPVTFGHHLLAYVEMLGRDRSRLADARRAAERMPAGRRGACRHQLPDRSGDDRGRARLRPAGGQLDRRRLRPRLRAGLPGRGRHLRRAPVAPGRGAGAVVDAAVRLRADARGLHLGQLDHAAEAQPRRRRAGARQVGADPGRPAGACWWC